MNLYNILGKETHMGKDNRYFKYSDKAINSIYLGFFIFKDLYTNSNNIIKFNYPCLENKFKRNLKNLLEYLSNDFNKTIYHVLIDPINLKIGPKKITIRKINSKAYKIIYL